MQREPYKPDWSSAEYAHLTRVEREYLQEAIAEMRAEGRAESAIAMWAKGYTDSKRMSTMPRYERELYPTRREADNA
jgi:hypothetical protein